MKVESRFRVTAVIALAVFLFSCTVPRNNEALAEETALASATQSLKISWIANREKAVNSAGGGYRVYYGRVPGFAVGTAAFVDVPFVAGATAPTAKTLMGLPAGDYYIRVAAYSQQNPEGSIASAEISGHVAANISALGEVR